MRQAAAVVRFVVSRSFGRDPRKAVLVGAIWIAGFVTIPLAAIATRTTANAALAHDSVRAGAAGAVAALLWLTAIAFGHVMIAPLLEIADLSDLAIDQELIGLGSESPGVDHLERPAYADTLETFRSSSQDLFWGFRTLLTALGLLVQLGLTTVILASVQPRLAALPLFALPPLLAGRWAHRRVDRTRQREAERSRLNRHLLELLARAEPAKEIRIFGLGEELRRKQRETWDAMTSALWRAAAAGASARALGQLVFAAVYLLAVFSVVRDAVSGGSTVGDALLTIVLAGQLNQQSSQALGLSYSIHGLAAAVRRIEWLRSAAATAAPPRGERPAPARIEDAIVFDHVTFRYPAASRPALEDVSLRLPAGAVVAVVGENGAGKTTLGKLLCRLYEPGEGRITVDGIDLREIDVEAWRRRITAAFQDFARFEVRAKHTVGIGKLEALEDERVIGQALELAGAADVVAELPRGLETQLGTSYTDGRELSGGQWQKLALGRAMMPRSPLVVLLDEPTFALDAQAEHALFERYARHARAAAGESGAVTILVSHRFSTVRSADLIVVVQDGRILESGSHEELMDRRGLYAELFELQARAYLRG